MSGVPPGHVLRPDASRGLEHVGVLVDDERNAVHAAVVSPPGAPCTVRVLATDAERMIARHVCAVLADDAKEQR